MTRKMEIEIASPPDREKLVANIFFDNEQWAELNQEEGVLELELYPRRDGMFWQLSLEDVLKALDEAKRRLTSE